MYPLPTLIPSPLPRNRRRARDGDEPPGLLTSLTQFFNDVLDGAGDQERMTSLVPSRRAAPVPSYGRLAP